MRCDIFDISCTLVDLTISLARPKRLPKVSFGYSTVCQKSMHNLPKGNQSSVKKLKVIFGSKTFTSGGQPYVAIFPVM